MPLPLPNLDTRRWADLVDEGRALIPRYAPSWTDHNIHDPGNTLIELQAWLVEQEIYRTNRVPDRHRRKFLALAGFPVEPPRPARAVLEFAPAGGAAVNLPAGLVIAAAPVAGEAGPGALLPFSLTTAITVVPAGIRAVQSFDGAAYVDRTRQWLSRQPFPAWGEDPRTQGSGLGTEPPPPPPADGGPALYLGLDQAPPAGSEFRLWLAFAGGRSGEDERARLIAEQGAQEALCRPPQPVNLPDCGAPSPEPEPAPSGDAAERHHSMTAVWEYFGGTGWKPLAATDQTRALTLDGPVVITAPPDMAAGPRGAVADPLFYIRCRLLSGRPDAAPVLRSVAMNAAPAEQAVEARTRFEIAPGTVPPAGQEPAPWQRRPLRLAFDGFGRITALAAVPGGPWPEALVLDYQPATADASGWLTCTLVHPGVATGLPGQAMTLPGAPLAGAAPRLWVLGPAGAEEWRPARDLDAAGRTSALFSLDPDSGAIGFGDGERGRVPERGAAIVAQYRTTAGGAGNVAGGARWLLAGADDLYNQAVLGGGLAALEASIASIANALPAWGGRMDDPAGAAGRAAEALWSHERLLELLPPGQGSLDQAGRAAVLARPAPPRAATLADIERIALDVPGTAIGRARAWAGLDPAYPCLEAPGTVTLIVVPTLPAGRPEPTPELLGMVRRYLRRRRTVGTRLVVTGPEYVEVRVQASVRVRPRADAARTREDILSALNTFLDPMRGGPAGRGWPFGRDVYRSEILQVIDGVPGVDYVLSLSLFSGRDETPCGNVCVGITALTTPGPHQVEVS